MTKPSELTSGQVRAIRASDEPTAILAERYGLMPAMVGRIQKRMIRKDVGEVLTPDEFTALPEPAVEGEQMVETNELSVGEKEGLRVQLGAKLASMQPHGIIPAPTEDVDADIAMLTERIEKIQKEHLAKRCETLGVPPDPKWSIDRFHEEIEKALVPDTAPEGVNVMQIGVRAEGPWVKVKCIIPRVHLGNGQTMSKMQTGLVNAETADILERNEQCVRIEEQGETAQPAEADA